MFQHQYPLSLQAFANAVRTTGGMTNDGGFTRLSVATLVVDEILINRKPTAATAIAAMGSLISSGDRNGQESD
jgi:hypothetical protein